MVWFERLEGLAHQSVGLTHHVWKPEGFESRIEGLVNCKEALVSEPRGLDPVAWGLEPGAWGNGASKLGQVTSFIRMIPVKGAFALGKKS